MTAAAADLRERVSRLPGLERVLPALAGLPPAFLVGGAVRDLLRGAPQVDLDLAVEGDARAAARKLAAAVGGDAVEHERFGTATVTAEGVAVDLATTRRERYPRPGDLPVVEPAPLAEDLARRDFTINAMAIALSGDDLGRLHDPHGGVADLERGAIRVLHRGSFLDDPTRLLRGVRYELRLGYAMDEGTEALARAAGRGGAFATVSGARVSGELMPILAEPEAPAGLSRLRDLGLDRTLHPALRAEAELAAAAALGSVETGADRALAVLAALVSSAPDELEPWIEDLNLGAAARDRVIRAARSAPRLAVALRETASASAVHALLRDEPAEALALALALGAPSEPVLGYVHDLSRVRLEITGADLVAAGVPESPAVGRALQETLRRKLDGEVSGREDELAMALEIAREAA